MHFHPSLTRSAFLHSIFTNRSLSFHLIFINSSTNFLPFDFHKFFIHFPCIWFSQTVHSRFNDIFPWTDFRRTPDLLRFPHHPRCPRIQRIDRNTWHNGNCKFTVFLKCQYLLKQRQFTLFTFDRDSSHSSLSTETQFTLFTFNRDTVHTIHFQQRHSLLFTFNTQFTLFTFLQLSVRVWEENLLE